jgi:tetratricopeptide (TPR) repeat protein
MSRQKLLKPRGRFWTYEEIDEMTTEEIVWHLHGMGIPFDEEEFLQATEECFSAEEISEGWFESFDVLAEGANEDFPWFAAWVLWDRLAPDENLSLEGMDNLIDLGFNLLSDDEPTAACDVWLLVWEGIKYKLKYKPSTLAFLDEHYRGTFFITNFIQDLEMELRNAGMEDEDYFQKRIEYCKEFLTFFPNEGDYTFNMRRALAESYAYLGDYEQADMEFERLIKDYPDNPWGYIGWGDIYVEKDDYPKAKEIFLKALTTQGDMDGVMAAQERLDRFEEEGLG